MTDQGKKYYYWEDFIQGQMINCGSKTITEEEIIEFAKVYDPQRFHISSDEAKDTIFKGLIASGWQTASIMMRLVCDAFMIHSSSNGSPGVEQLKWLKPVRPGDILSVEVEVLQTKVLNSKPHLGMIQTRWSCFNQAREINTTLEAWIMFGRKNPATSS